MLGHQNGRCRKRVMLLRNLCNAVKTLYTQNCEDVRMCVDAGGGKSAKGHQKSKQTST